MKSRVAIGLYIFLMTVPLAAGLGYSLLYSFGLAGLLNEGFTMKYWAALLGGGDVWWSLGYTFVLSLGSLILSVMPAMLLAYLLQFRQGNKGLRRFLLLPMTLPPLIAGFAMYHLLSPSGFLSRLAYWLGFAGGMDDFPRFVNDAAGIGILATHVLLLFPLFTLVFSNISRKERLPELYKIGATLGAKEGQFLWRIWIPVVLRRAAAFLMLYFVFLLGAYEVPLLLGRSSPRVVSIYIVEQVGRYDLHNIPLGHAMVVLYALLVGLLTVVFIRSKRSQGL